MKRDGFARHRGLVLGIILLALVGVAFSFSIFVRPLHGPNSSATAALNPDNLSRPLQRRSHKELSCFVPALALSPTGTSLSKERRVKIATPVMP